MLSELVRKMIHSPINVSRETGAVPLGSGFSETTS
jgi:hypothetical protein